MWRRRRARVWRPRFGWRRELGCWLGWRRGIVCSARVPSRGECEGYLGFDGGLWGRGAEELASDLGYRLRLGWPGSGCAARRAGLRVCSGGWSGSPEEALEAAGCKRSGSLLVGWHQIGSCSAEHEGVAQLSGHVEARGASTVVRGR